MVPLFGKLPITIPITSWKFMGSLWESYGKRGTIFWGTWKFPWCHVGTFFGFHPVQSRQNLRPVTLDAVTWQQQVLSTRRGSGFLKRRLNFMPIKGLMTWILSQFFFLFIFFVIINSIKDSDVFLYCFVMAWCVFLSNRSSLSTIGGDHTFDHVYIAF